MTLLLKATFWFTLGLFGGVFLHPPFWVLFWMGILCAFLGFFIRHQRGGRLFLWTAIFCLGALRWEGAVDERQSLEKAFGEEREAWIEGIVSTDPVPSSHGRQTFLLQVETPWPLRPKVKVLAPYDYSFRVGERLWLRVLFSPFHSSGNPGSFDQRSYFHGRSIYGICRFRDLDPILKKEARPLHRLKQGLFAWKRSLLQKIRQDLPDPEASFLGALLLGDRTRIDPELWDLLSEIGVVHLLAISGGHVWMVVACCYFFLKHLGLSKRTALAATLLFLWIFVELVGEAPPILRSGWMATVFLVGKLLWRHPASFHTLAVSFLMLTWINPFYLFESGFQLSFLSVLMILISLPSAQKAFSSFNNLLRLPIQSLWLNGIIWIGILPVVAYHFHLFSPIALLANLFAVPHSFLLVILGLIWFAFSSWVPFFSKPLLALLSLITSVGLRVFWFLSKVPFGFFHVGRPSVTFFASYYLFLLLWMVAPRLRLRRQKVLLPALLLLNLWIWGLFLKPQENVLRVTFFDVGHGDSILCEFPKGGTLLIDGGRRDERFDAGRDLLAPALWAKGYERLDAVVLTHTDGDHLGGLPSLLRECKPHSLFESGISASSRLYREYQEAVKELGIEPTILRRGDKVEGIPGVSLEVLHPPNPFLKGTGRDENNNGIVLRLTYGEATFLFTADLEREGIQDLLESRQGLSANILKVPHHGGALENGERFFQSVHPKVAVISVGPVRTYSLPATNTLAQLKRIGSRIHQTVQEGAITVESDGTSFQIRTNSTTREDFPAQDPR